MWLPGIILILVTLVPSCITHFQSDKGFTKPDAFSLYDNISWGQYIYTTLRSKPLFMHLNLNTFNSPVNLAMFLLMAGDISLNPGPCVDFAFTNIQSLKAKHASVSHFIKSNNPSILGLTETWLTNVETASLLAEITPKGYNLLHTPRPSRRGGGVGFLIAQALSPRKLDTPIFDTFENILVAVNLENSTFNLVSIYRPPSTNIHQFIEEFSDFLEQLASNTSPTIISGDFNIHVDQVSNNTTAFLDSIEAFDLKQHIDFSTHLLGHTLDLLITPSDFTLLTNIRVVDTLCDHFCIGASFSMPNKSQSRSETILYRKYNNINLQDLKTDLRSSELLNSTTTSVNEMHDLYQDTLSNLLDKHAPLKRKTFNPNKQQKSPWINDSIIEARRRKRQLERIWRRNKTPLNRSNFRKQVNFCNRLINKAKSDFYSDLISSNSDDSRNLWNSLNKILHRSPPPALPQCDNNRELANKFSDFFLQKIETVRSTLPSSDSEFKDLTRSPNCTISKFSTVTQDDVLKIIKKSPIKSCMLDPWPTFLVMECIDILISPITKFINLCLSQGHLPDSFKQAVVIPLLKKPTLCKETLKNYRPVSNLSYLSKLLERIIASQIKQYLDSNKLCISLQSAYRSGHSTESALLNVKNDIHLHLARGEQSVLVLLDLSAAFDTIDHPRLLARLKHLFGFSGSVLNWFSNYITNRMQKVKIGDSFSANKTLAYGVPQGSVLGPLLFTLYTSPLASVLAEFPAVGYHLYADDTQLYMNLTPENAVTALDTLNSCTLAIFNWLSANKLKVNPDKTELILFGNRQHSSRLTNLFPIDLLGTKLEPANTVRNLGVIFDSALTLSNHVSSICKSAFYFIKDLRRIRRTLNKSTATAVANALVGSRLDYCNSLLFSLTKKELNRLQRVQNVLCRIVCKLPRRAGVSASMKSMHWLPLRSRILFKTYTLIYRTIQTGSPHYLKNHLRPFTSNRNTRRSNPANNNLATVFFNSREHRFKSHLENSFTYSAPRLWNSLPLEIRNSPSMSIFRRRIKAFLFSSAYPP